MLQNWGLKMLSEKDKQYGDLVQNILGNDYTINDEIAILKHALEALIGDGGSEEWKAYVQAGEKAKASAKADIAE